MIPKLIYASTKNSDMLYAVKTTVPDSFFLLEIGKRKLVFLDKRELGVFKEHDAHGEFEIVPLEPLIKKSLSLKIGGGQASRLALVIIQKYIPKVKEIMVPVHFPLDMADFLRSQEVMLKVMEPFYPQRSIKNKTEIAAIETAIKKTHIAYQRIEEILKASIIKGYQIIFNGNVLISEFIKQEVDRVLLEQNMLNTEGIIISSGKQAAMPHHMGSGPILPNEPIICDIFPRDRSTGYFADMTRTYVKGQASKEMGSIYQAVLESQQAGINAVRPGVTGRDVHRACVESFLANKYDVGNKGFIHNTGHGLGLDIHESPYLKHANEEPLMPGNIVTIEPGLYYSDRGSARIEDVVVVTKTGCRNLTNYPKVLEIS